MVPKLEEVPILGEVAVSCPRHMLGQLQTDGLARFCPFEAAMDSPNFISVRWIVNASNVWSHLNHVCVGRH